MAYQTINATDAATYPAMARMIGKSVTPAEYRSLQKEKAPVSTEKRVAAKKAAAKKAPAKKATAKKTATKKK